MKSSNLGYPRIGEKREWKKALEQFWTGKLEKEPFLKQMEEIRLKHLQKQKDQGIDLIPVGDFSLYDHVLDTAVMFGLVPKRFIYKGGKVSLETYFEIARGTKDAVAAEMTKWFNTNYHYIVPELDQTVPTLVENRPLQFYKEAKQKLGIKGKPVIIGPVTFVKLSKGYTNLKTVIHQFIPLYAEILRELQAEGVDWVQVDEPILTTSLSREEVELIADVYQQLHDAAPNVNILLQTYFDSIDYYEKIFSLPVQGIGLDFIHDRGENLASLKKFGFPEDKVLAAGILDGRNIWRANLDEKLSLLSEIAEIVPEDRLIVQPSSSLLHVPVTVKSEDTLEEVLKNALSFADEKLHEVVVLTKGLRLGKDSIKEEIASRTKAIKALNESTFRNNQQVQNDIQNLASVRAERDVPFNIRQAIQETTFRLPLLPTTTIGSFPQTQEVRKQRQLWRKGELTDAKYEKYINAEIKKWIEIQEKLGLDVFVHGEFERTDMVEYFGEKLAGFQFTKYGWVQSYGSRCVKPPLIYGDVSFQDPMTVKETVYAQSLTEKPVKGMLTGPITILNWSFVRDDIPRFEVANQIALALRKEVELLEENGISMIQVDEPALREGLPLKRENWASYLNAAVYAFKLSTTSVRNETQIHTHMCYANFEDIIDAINALDADVISIETSRSHGELLSAFEENIYDKGIGLGVYDIHSPRVPALEELTRNIERALQVLEPKLFWINPDCGLKTRGLEETIAALEVMVEAAEQVREKLVVKK
ncbi:5-methyltetrahydropteroyltriglutamate--homocysteine S-methyltransferase [Bacillus sp. AFS076308]|uniref:5-methyltetrahydropteroyltriglutamate-- homocysteine S-methyltransferase n=1 Tax=unclassified Bacillus (in: firmicutes) TaxID=185979 RepID=UPI000BF91C29|nr:MULTISPECIES: 5-methyltetrahydropteroyltriglutamate--homocysteine S-methyltransferase [unclassified Bacillus (in: firmicutes)]PFN99255.1 5-methyltetrahydropteroyltriglutamate--homocysteine S-methyltransferase [Bacillus sp. AFS076308]PGV49156.1 5-methyltetrahydropteroyltriglutamate--homocysteine S-methyltransferase [Bacillus sp. AFS037270]